MILILAILVAGWVIGGLDSGYGSKEYVTQRMKRKRQRRELMERNRRVS